jgi:uncharacterized membrane protein YjjP (DUF1212 family)
MNPVAAVNKPPRPDEPRARFLLELARALGTYGTSSSHLEDVVGVCAAEMGLNAQTFCTPTSVFVTVENEDDVTTYLARITPGEADISKLMELDRIFNLVIEESLTPSEAILEIKNLVRRRVLYPAWMTVLAFTLVSGSAGYLLGGHIQEIIVSWMVGFTVGVLVLFTGKKREFSRLMEFLSGLCAALIAGLMTLVFDGYVYSIPTIAGIIILLPGLTLTIAMVELATKNVVSGTARLAGALMVLLVMVFGIVIGQHVVEESIGKPSIIESTVRLPWGFDFLAIFIATLSMIVLFQASVRHAWVMVLSGLISFFSARYGSLFLGPEIGVLGAAVLVGTSSNLYARVFDRPALTMMLPGLLILVPGSLGLRSLQLFMNSDTMNGVQSSVMVLTVGVSLVVGLLLSNVILPPRKVL